MKGRVPPIINMEKIEMMKENAVTLAHGAGGKQTNELIDQVFKRHFSNPDLTADDAAVLTLNGKGKIAFTTDGFIVSPYEFPGGNIGKLSICGTVNDLACMGARPKYLSCAFVIEEGFSMEKLEEIASAMEKTAAEAGVKIVAGDTKVAGKGQVDKIFITTTGIGEILENAATSGFNAKEGAHDRFAVDLRCTGIKGSGNEVLAAAVTVPDVDGFRTSVKTACNRRVGIRHQIFAGMDVIG